MQKPEDTTTAGPLALSLHAGLGPLPEAVQPVAYLYHDAASAETANPMLDSTLVLMAADRRPTLRNETPLVTLAQAQAMVDTERQRWILKAGATYTDAHSIFNDPPSCTSQDVRDVIEWHLAAMRANEDW